MSADAADPFERLLFEKPQQLRLQPRRHLADFVEKHRAAVGRSRAARASAARASGEGAALVAEQLAFEQRLGQRRARDVHERPRRAVAGVVQHFRGEVLAGAALAGQQHRRRRAGGDLLQQRLHAAIDRRALADDAIDAVRAAPGVARSARTSRRSRVVSSAFSTSSAISSRLNGLFA